MCCKTQASFHTDLVIWMPDQNVLSHAETKTWGKEIRWMEAARGWWCLRNVDWKETWNLTKYFLDWFIEKFLKLKHKPVLDFQGK